MFTASSDYESLTAALLFTPAGPRELCHPVTVLDDTVHEGTEEFSACLTSSLGARVIVATPIPVVITDDDGRWNKYSSSFYSIIL